MHQRSSVQRVTICTPPCRVAWACRTFATPAPALSFLDVPPLHVSDLQQQTETATDSSVLSLLQHCHTLLRGRLTRTASVVDELLPTLVQSSIDHLGNSRPDSSLQQARQVAAAFAALPRHAAFEPSSEIKLDAPQAEAALQVRRFSLTWLPVLHCVLALLGCLSMH